MKVWDLSTRLYHWAQAVLFVALMATGFSGNGPHVQLGLVIMTLIVWRIIWGFVGSETSRFKQFLRSPKRVINYLLGREISRPGHNPAGGWMVITLVSMLLIQCISGMALAGLFDNLPHAEVRLTDEVYSFVESLHLLLANSLPVLVGLHVVAILFYKLRSKPLTWAMVTGKQTFPKHEGSVLLVSQWRALLVLVLATSVTMAIVAFS